MEIAIYLTITITGILIGVVTTDFTHRFILTKRLDKIKLEMEDTVKSLAKEHNAIAEKMIVIQDTIQSHEFKLSGRSIAGLSKEK